MPYLMEANPPAFNESLTDLSQSAFKKGLWRNIYIYIYSHTVVVHKSWKSKDFGALFSLFFGPRKDKKRERKRRVLSLMVLLLGGVVELMMTHYLCTVQEMKETSMLLSSIIILLPKCEYMLDNWRKWG